MGVPKLLHTLTPFAERCPLQDAQITVDGPALAYHVVHLCQAELAVTTATATTTRATAEASAIGRCPLEQPTYRRLGEVAVAWLDELCSRGNTISALFFDGYLPEAKRPVRLERVSRSSVQWKVLFQLNQRELPCRDRDGVSPRKSHSLPAPAFSVPAVLEALRQSPRYGPLTQVVPGEADSFCAEHVRAAGCGTILTSDSDLLVHDLGSDGHVVLFRDVYLGKRNGGGGHGIDTPPLIVPVFSSVVTRRRLALASHADLLAFAFELSVDPHLSTTELAVRARKREAATLLPREYVAFLAQYAPPLPPDSTLSSSADIHALDPRISEVALQFLVRGSDVPGPDLDQGENVMFFVPSLLESWERPSAWESSMPLRRCAYSLLRLAMEEEKQGLLSAVREYVRVASPAARGAPLELLPVPQAVAAVKDLLPILRRIQKLFRSAAAADSQPELPWVAFSTYQDIIWSRSHDKVPVSLTVLGQETRADGTLDPLTWNAVHWLAQAQASMYSLRMLQQVIGFLETTQKSTAAGQRCQENAYLQELRDLLKHLPPIADYPTLQTLVCLPSQLKKTGALLLVSELAELSEPIEFPRAVTEHKTVNKKRKRLNAHPAAPAGRNGRSKNPFSLLDDGEL